MEVHGPRNPGRPEAGRARESDSASRRSARVLLGGAAVDRVEPGDSVLIDRSVTRVRHEIERRAHDVRTRRVELLARVHDPEAVRRAALSLLRSGVLRRG